MNRTGSVDAIPSFASFKLAIFFNFLTYTTVSNFLCKVMKSLQDVFETGFIPFNFYSELILHR